MQIGDLVRVRPDEPSAGNLGIIVTLGLELIQVYWLTGNRSVSHCCWIETECLEVICE